MKAGGGTSAERGVNVSGEKKKYRRKAQQAQSVDSDIKNLFPLLQSEVEKKAEIHVRRLH